MANNIKITLVKSLIGARPDVRKNAESLGLTKVNSSVVKQDTPTIRGMINKVSSLVKVEEK
ncbi:50S ribosomal protein L30 [Mycoplasmatota bacterium]|nr:50S ribosomal protein L30 [Mycoplasmatota bacterium]